MSRGGLKLAHALAVFDVDVEGKTCLDVGSSTGGFTNVLLTHGAAKVFAVDIGTDQLHPKIRSNERVTVMEQTDARTLTLPEAPDIIVCDASFISATKVLETPLTLAAPKAHLITLVKPQFEVGKAGIGKGGIVKSEDLALKALIDVSIWVEEQGWRVLARDTSPITGGSGNTEYLLHAVKNMDTSDVNSPR